MKISAVVVTWNSERDISACLASLVHQTHKLDLIIVIDNASNDNTFDIINKKFPQIKLVQKDLNLGFATANNIGIGMSDSEWVLTLNPDARIEPDWIEVLLKFAQGKERIGTLGGMLYREQTAKTDERIIDTVGIEIFNSRRVRDRGFGVIDTGQFAINERVFGICAAACLYRREMLDDTMIDGEVFAENFFSYYEDADLAWRGWRRGWKAWYVPSAIGWHRRGGSDVGSRFSRVLTHRNRYWMIARNEPLWRMLFGGFGFYWHEVLIFLRMLRYPYLFGIAVRTFLGAGKAARQRESLEDSDATPLPFRRGSGFQ
jgi:GT2 family glycosyltransferase